MLNSDKVKNIKNKYIILLTDGAPNSSAGTGNISLPASYVTGYDANGTPITSKSWDVLPSGGAQGSKIGRQYAMAYAKQINQSSAMEMFAVGLSLNGDNGEKNANWMKYNIAKDTNHWVEANNLGNLDLAFKNILESIKTAAEAYTVQDPLGEYMDFVQFNKSIENAGEKIVTWEDTTFKWDLKKDTPIGEIVEDKGCLTYTLSYRVRLDNTKQNFIAENWYAANNKTTLTYAYLEEQDGKLIAVGNNKVVDFRIPQVKGYFAKVNSSTDINFVKTDEDGEPLSSVTFNLKFACDSASKHNHDSNSAFAEIGGAEAISDKDGKFSFSNIPSGHTYTLTEDATTTPENYVTGGPWTVSVNYGEVTITDTSVTASDNKLTGNKDNQFVIVNNKATGDIKFIKVSDEKDKTTGENVVLSGATFGLYSDAGCESAVVDKDNNAITATSAADGIVKFTDLTPGTYYVKELTAPAGFALDSTVYTVTVVAGQTVGVKSGDNQNVVNHEQVTITGTKTWLDGNGTGRPASITVGLFNSNNNNKVAEQTVTAESSWSYSFTAPKYDANGNAIAYTVRETKVGNDAVTNTTTADVTTGTTKTVANATTGYYVVTYNGNNITNKFVKDVTATKTWIDGNDENRPEITVQLLQGDTVYDEKTITSPATSCTWIGVPVNDADGKAYTYTVKETKIGDKNVTYEGNSLTAIAGDYKVVNNGLTITNTKLTSVSGQKVWNYNGQDSY